MGYTISISFIAFLRKFCVNDEIFDKVLLGLLNLKVSKLGQILSAYKIGFCSLSHIKLFDSYLFVADLSMYVLRNHHDVLMDFYNIALMCVICAVYACLDN